MSADDPLIGTEIGRFRLTRLIGKGGMGRVYLGVHPSIGSRVAIKLLAEDCADQPELLERFFTEARAVNLIQHENIVAITDLDRLPTGRPYIVMEYIEGRTVRELVERGPAPLGGIIEIMRDVLVALDAAHQVEIIHRDLKPDNVIVTALGRAKVLDFGIAKLVERSTVRTATGAAIGTPHYMAPEQIRGGACDARTDVYAAGVMLFELVTGTRPYDGDSDFQLMEAHLRAPIPSAGAPSAIEAVISRALAKDPGERFPSAQAMADALVAAGETLDDAVLVRFESSVLRPKVSAPTLKAPITAATKADGPASKPRVDEVATVDGTGPRTPAPPVTPRPPPPAARTPRWMVGALVGLTLVAAVAIGFAVSKREVVRVVEAPRTDAPVVAQVSVDAMIVVPPVDAELLELDAAPATRRDAGAPVKSPKVARSSFPTHACKEYVDCPVYGCLCKNAWVRTAGCHPDTKVCGQPASACAPACKNEGGWTGTVSMMKPLGDADCAPAVNCKERGECKARRGVDPELLCVKSCADMTACKRNGLCVDTGAAQCVAADQTCADSEWCTAYGFCAARNGVCVTTAEGCERQASCAASGDCGPSPDGKACVPRTDEDCQKSKMCARGGYCAMGQDSCVAADQQACSSSPMCADQGYCTLKQGTCWTTEASCQASAYCKSNGICHQSAYRNECSSKDPR